MAKLTLSLVTPGRQLVRAEVDMVTAPSVLGEVGILPDHRALLAELGPGVVVAKTGDKLERYVDAVGTIAQLEPLLGLLGTVTGMIQVFQQVVATSEHGAVDPGRLAAGIWEALITTAAGLIIGIPVLVAHRYLLSR